MQISSEFVLCAPASVNDMESLEHWFGRELPSQLVILLAVSNGIAFMNPYLPGDAPPESWVDSCQNIISGTTALRAAWQINRLNWEQRVYPDNFGDPLNYLVFASTLNGDSVSYRWKPEESLYELVLIGHEMGDVEILDPQDLFQLLPMLDPYDRE